MSYRGDEVQQLTAENARLREELEGAEKDREALRNERDSLRRDRGMRVTERARSLYWPVALIGTVVAAIVAGVIVTADGCGADEPPLRAGYVTDHWNVPAHTYTTSVCVPAGKTMICHPQVHHVPTHYYVIISHAGRVREVNLTRDDWNATAEGRWLCIEEPCQ